MTPCIAIDSQNQILVIWAEMDWPIPDIADILYMTKNDSTWSPIMESVSQLYDSRFPSLVVDRNDIFHMTFQDGLSLQEGDVFYRSFNFFDVFWSNIERIHQNPQPSSFPDIAVSADGTPHILWVHVFNDDGNSRIVMKSKSQTGWPDKFKSISKNTIDFSIHPSLAEKEKILYTAWEDNRTGTPKIFFNYKKAEFWGAPLQVSDQENDTWPKISIDHRNNVHIIYSSSTGNVFHVHRQADTWKTPVILSSGVSPTGAKDFKITKNNLLHTVWKQNNGNSTCIYYSRGTTDGNWLQPIQVAPGTNADFPRLCISDNDEIHIVWTDIGIGGTRDVYYKKISLLGKKPTVGLNASASQGIIPSEIHFDASTSTAGNGQILSCWWDFGNSSAMIEGSQTTHNFTTPGIHTVKLFVTNTQLLSSVKSIDINILAGPFPPTNIQVSSVEEGGLLFREKINVVSWKENPENTPSVTIKYYRIYRKLKTKDNNAFKQIGQVSGASFIYVDRNFVFSKDYYLYDYAVSSIDNHDREGQLGPALAKAMTK